MCKVKFAVIAKKITPEPRAASVGAIGQFTLYFPVTWQVKVIDNPRVSGVITLTYGSQLRASQGR